jgi:hypothetical protein
MLKATWRRLGSPAWLAFGLTILLPTLAQAQLFPNRTIRRERPPCSSEPPFNAQVRRDYFGYYPTCWTRFPAGWECPGYNPEKPNLDQSIKDYGPMGGQKRPAVDTGPGMDDANPDNPGGRQPGNPNDNPIPLPNQGRSPFELDPNPKPPGANPGVDPFTPPSPPTPTPPVIGPGGRPGTSAGVMEMPSLPATSPSTSYESPLKPGAIAMASEATLASSNSSDLRPDLGPLPPPPVSMPNNLTSPTDPTSQPVLGTPTPAQAPRRRGFLSSLFGPKNTQNR